MPRRDRSPAAVDRLPGPRRGAIAALPVALGLFFAGLSVGGCERRGAPAGMPEQATAPVDRTTDGPASAPSAAGPASDPAVAPAGRLPERLADCRFASLSPALTQVLVDLGLGGQIVGRTPFCDSVPETVTVVGSLLDVDYERLLQSAPTHVVVQPAAAGTDPELERLATEHRWVLIERGLDRLGDVEAFLRDLVPQLALPASAETTALAERCDVAARSLAALHGPLGAAAPAAGTRTVVLVATEPLTAVGTDTFVSEMLAAAGASNAITAGGYPELSYEDLATIDPETIVVLLDAEPGPGEREAILRRLLGSPTKAAASRRVAIHVDPESMLPSTRAPAAVTRLRACLSGLDAAGAVDGTKAGGAR